MKKITKPIIKPNTKKTDQAYWEKVLASHGLGINQPLTDNSHETGGDIEQKVILTRATTVSNKDNAKLRREIDGSDGFMSAHQIAKVRGIEREIPEWSLNDKEVQKLLLVSFPKLKTSPKQRKRAGRWVRVIYLYYRMALPRQIVAKELGITYVALETLTRGITRASKGLTCDKGKPRKCHSSNTL